MTKKEYDSWEKCYRDGRASLNNIMVFFVAEQRLLLKMVSVYQEYKENSPGLFTKTFASGLEKNKKKLDDVTRRLQYLEKEEGSTKQSSEPKRKCGYAPDSLMTEHNNLFKMGHKFEERDYVVFNLNCQRQLDMKKEAQERQERHVRESQPLNFDDNKLEKMFHITFKKERKKRAK